MDKIKGQFVCGGGQKLHNQVSKASSQVRCISFSKHT